GVVGERLAQALESAVDRAQILLHLHQRLRGERVAARLERQQQLVGGARVFGLGLEQAGSRSVRDQRPLRLGGPHGQARLGGTRDPPRDERRQRDQERRRREQQKRLETGGLARERHHEPKTLGDLRPQLALGGELTRQRG